MRNSSFRLSRTWEFSSPGKSLPPAEQISGCQLSNNPTESCRGTLFALTVNRFRKRLEPVRKVYRFRCALFAFAAICGCRETVVTDLSQRQALEVAAFLSSRGIWGEIVPVGHGPLTRFAVRTDGSAIKEAVVALAQAQLPSEKSVSSDELLMSNAGLVPASSFVERHRMDRALAAQLEEQLKLLPGVVAVRAVLRLHTISLSVRPEKETLPGPQLSVVVKAAPGVIIREQLLSITARIVPELSETEIGLVVVVEEGSGVKRAQLPDRGDDGSSLVTGK